MDHLELQTDQGRTAYLPADTVAGNLRWALDRPAECIQLQLFWTTRGKGIVDTRVVDSLAIEDPQAQGERPFALRLPAAPYSFSGKLVSVVWSLRAQARPGGLETQLNITVSPSGHEIDLSVPLPTA
jgi:hypothetical protein